MKIYPLKEGDFFVNKNKQFYPLSESEELKGLKMAVQPFLIEVKHELVLLDAGLGWPNNDIPQIHENIRSAGFLPKNITKILLSHLHKDHIDGLVNKAQAGWKLNFPDTTVYIQKREYEYAMTKGGSASFDLVVLQFIIDNANIVWMNEDKGQITENILYEVSGGHTPYHQVFWVKESGETAFYGADNLPTASYLRIPIAYKADHNGKLAMEERQNWERQAKEENWKILLYHDMERSIWEL